MANLNYICNIPTLEAQEYQAQMPQFSSSDQDTTDGEQEFVKEATPGESTNV